MEAGWLAGAGGTHAARLGGCRLAPLPRHRLGVESLGKSAQDCGCAGVTAVRAVDVSTLDAIDDELPGDGLLWRQERADVR